MSNKINKPSAEGTAGQFLTLNANNQVQWSTAQYSVTDLTDVTLTSVQSNNILVFDSNTNKWTNKGISEMLADSNTIKQLIVTYQDLTNVTQITLTAGKYYRLTNTATTLNINVNSNSNRSSLTFTTGDSPSVTLSLPSDGSFKLPVLPTFESNTSYLITVDNYIISCNSVQTYE